MNHSMTEGKTSIRQDLPCPCIEVNIMIWCLDKVQQGEELLKKGVTHVYN